MVIRQAKIEEFQALWCSSGSTTYKYFLDKLRDKTVEFWTIDQGELIGELYIFWDSEDKDEADGLKRAYLCALRVHEDHRGQGMSSKLMNRVIESIYERGFSEITIGIDNDNYDKLKMIYKKWGFTKLIKKQYIDHHGRDKHNQANRCQEGFDIFMKRRE